MDRYKMCQIDNIKDIQLSSIIMKDYGLDLIWKLLGCAGLTCTPFLMDALYFWYAFILYMVGL